MKDFLKKFGMKTFISFLFAILIFFGLYNHGIINFPPKIFTKYVEIVKEVEVKSEADKKVETKNFIAYLNPRIDDSIASKIGITVDKYSEEYQLPRKLILSIIYAESSFNPLASSSVAYGLMQIYPKYHPEKLEALNIKDKRRLFHIDTNINIGCQIFKEYLDKSDGNLDKTFLRYLSTNATKSEIREYKENILRTLAKIELFEYETLNKNIKNKIQIEDKKEEDKKEEDKKEEDKKEEDNKSNSKN